VLDGSLATPSFLLKSAAAAHVVFIYPNEALACKMPVICSVMSTALAFPSAPPINPYLILPKTGALAEMAYVWLVGPDRQVHAVSATDRAAQEEFFAFALHPRFSMKRQASSSSGTAPAGAMQP